jgi:diguanylate cyclase (GGDEF)-like protein/PAS domain S-box-containing protein
MEKHSTNHNKYKDKIETIEKEYSYLIELRKKVNPDFEALFIIAIYILFGVSWILLSDRILSLMSIDIYLYKKIELYKGWIYVLITGVVFYFIIKSKLKISKDALDKVFYTYEEIKNAHKDLISMDSKLLFQYSELEKSKNNLEISDQRYKLVTEGSNDGIWDWDISTDEFFFSIKYKNRYGYENDEIGNKYSDWLKLFHEEDKIPSLEKIDEYFKNRQGIYENTFRIRCKNGEYRWILSKGKAIWDEDGNPIRMAGSHSDITEFMKMQETLRSEKELSENIINDAPMMIIVIDIEGRIIKFNPYAERVTGYPLEEALKQNIIELLIPKYNRQGFEKKLREILDGKNLDINEIEILCKDGRKEIILWNNNHLHDNNNEIHGLVTIGVDMTERITLENKLENLAYYDQLTNLPNREHLRDKIDEMIKNSTDEKQKFALIYFDVDDFKNINDTMTHEIGDKLIFYISNILKNIIKEPNFVARIGGDEFVVIIKNVLNREQVIAEIEKITSFIKRPWVLNRNRFFISYSIGISIFPEHGKDYLTLVQNADTAISHIKETGKDSYAFYDYKMREKTWNYIQMISLLRDAIAKNEFELYYQPEIDLKTNNIIGVEALIRWNHPEKGMISPMEFIPIAEKSGQIGEITDWVIETAYKQKIIWEENGIKNLKISVNISGKIFSMAKSMDYILNSNKFDLKDIIFEITETAVMENMEKATELLNKVRKRGITIALDDFGTGYSSLTYLQKLPIDIIKIDREFVKLIDDNNDESYIIKTILDISHHFGLKVIGEGIETKKQKEFLFENGCDFGQGYFFSKPLPAKEIENIISFYNQ